MQHKVQKYEGTKLPVSIVSTEPERRHPIGPFFEPQMHQDTLKNYVPICSTSTENV